MDKLSSQMEFKYPWAFKLVTRWQKRKADWEPEMNILSKHHTLALSSAWHRRLYCMKHRRLYCIKKCLALDEAKLSVERMALHENFERMAPHENFERMALLYCHAFTYYTQNAWAYRAKLTQKAVKRAQTAEECAQTTERALGQVQGCQRGRSIPGYVSRLTLHWKPYFSQ